MREMRRRSLLVVACAALMAFGDGEAAAQSDIRPSFRAGVELVSVSAVVRDRRG